MSQVHRKKALELINKALQLIREKDEAAKAKQTLRDKIGCWPKKTISNSCYDYLLFHKEKLVSDPNWNSTYWTSSSLLHDALRYDTGEEKDERIIDAINAVCEFFDKEYFPYIPRAALYPKHKRSDEEIKEYYKKYGGAHHPEDKS